MNESLKGPLSMYSLTVIVPAYNESKTIENSLEKLLALDFLSQILIVNDGSYDDTLKIITNFENLDNRVKVFSNNKNQGKGYSLNSIRQFINSDYVVIHDADLEYDPSDLKPMFQLVNGENMILGTRFRGNKIRKNIYKRTNIANKVMSKFFSIVHKTNISDIAVCYKMMPASFFKTTEFKENGFSIEIEMVAKFLKFSSQINEVPISYYGRSYSEGKKIKSIDGLFYLLNTLKYKFF